MEIVTVLMLGLAIFMSTVTSSYQPVASIIFIGCAAGLLGLMLIGIIRGS